MKGIVKIVIIILVVLVALYIGKNVIAKTAVSAGVRAVTGLKMSIRSMDIGVIKTLVGIKDLRLYNPAGFKDKLMVDMPEIYADYDLGAFFKGKVHLEEVRLNLREFVVVKNEKGELNLDSLKIVQAKKGKAPAGAEEAKKAPEIQIDELELKIGKVIYKDYSKGGAPSVQEFNVNINERYSNITNPYTLANLIVFKALVNTSISNLANFDLGPIKEGLGNTLGTASKIAQDAAVKALEGVKAKSEGVVAEAVEKTEKILKTILPLIGNQSESEQ